MPRFHTKYFLVFATVLALYSCEEVVDLPFEVEPRLEISSDLSDERLVASVRVARDINGGNEIKYVDNAIVKVFKGEAFLEELELIKPVEGNGYPCYKSKTLVPEYEVEYTLVVEVENFKTLKAKTSIPRPVNLEDVSFVPIVTSGESDMVFVDFDISLSLNDPGATDNYYHLVFRQELVDFEIEANGDTTFYQPTLSQIEIDVMDTNSPVKKYRANDYLFTDTRFNGQFLTINFKGSFEFNKTKQIPGQFTIELRTVSEDYYNKLYSDIQISNSNEDPLGGEGHVVFNNTDNGLGSFIGFTGKRNTFRLTD
jgi:hypothetical protein